MAQCKGKKKYKSWKAAVRYIRNSRHLKHSASLNPYRCRECKNYHIGNNRGAGGVRPHIWNAVKRLRKKTKIDQLTELR